MHEYPDFEKPIYELIEKINELKKSTDGRCSQISQEIKKSSDKLEELTKKTYSSLTPWQIVQIARHPKRPKTLDIIENVFENFIELQGDRQFANCPSIIGGMAEINNQPVMVLAQHKGHELDDKIKHNFGMANPEGYRKCKRLMELAEKFNLPVICLIDTPGAYPGIDAEKRNQCEAIATNLTLMSGLKTPIISMIIGEGMSGGAIALGVADTVFMAEYAIYSVISPEGCASILWKDAKLAQQAAEHMKLTAQDLLQHQMIDQIIVEPTGGSHRFPKLFFSEIKIQVTDKLNQLLLIPKDQLVRERRLKLKKLTHLYHA